MTKQDTRLDWDDAQRRAKELVSRLTNEEKATLCTGTGWKKGPALGNIAAVPSIDFPFVAVSNLRLLISLTFEYILASLAVLLCKTDPTDCVGSTEEVLHQCV